MKRIDGIILSVIILLIIGVAAVQQVIQNNKKHSSSFFSSFQKKIGIISLEGVIMSEDAILSQLETARNDNSIAGLVFRVNSPGGAVAPSQEIYQGILAYRKETGNPVYMSMGTVAASGGYYIAAAGDRIFANSGTLTGSIGVIMQFSHYGDLLRKFGVQVSTITAGKLKDAGSPYRTLSTNDSTYFTDLLKDTHDQFIKDVAVARKMKIEKLRPYCEGQVFTGNMAKKIGLVDEIATYEQCCESLRKKLNLPESTQYVNFSLEEKSPLAQLLETKTPVKNVVSRLFPRSGVYYLAEEFQ